MHTYPETWDDARPEHSARWMIERLVPVLPDKQILVSEYGHNTNDGRTELDKGEALARAYFSPRTVPNFRGLIWYELRTGDESDHDTFGMVSHDDVPVYHSSFYTFADIAMLLRRGAYLGRGSTVPVWFVRLRDEHGDVYAVWREEDGPETLAFSFAAEASAALEVREVQTSSEASPVTAYPYSAGVNTVSLPLSTRVQLIRAPGGVVPDALYGFDGD